MYAMYVTLCRAVLNCSNIYIALHNPYIPIHLLSKMNVDPGYFPAGHATVQRNRKDSRPHALVKSHKDIESMRVKILNSLRAHANHSYRDGFCDDFPHNNHVRHVSREAVVAAMQQCAFEMAAKSGFCPLHCHTGGGGGG